MIVKAIICGIDSLFLSYEVKDYTFFHRKLFAFHDSFVCGREIG